MTAIIDGDTVAADLRRELSTCVETLEEAGITPGLATVLMSDDPASATYVSMKQQDCEELGIETFDYDLDPSTAEADLLEVIQECNNHSAVSGILVQLPLPDHVDQMNVIEAIDPTKDVDGFHPENLGRLMIGKPRFIPCTPHGILELLESVNVDPAGKDVVIVGRSRIVGKPLANLLLQKRDGGNATVTVCHSRTHDLATKTRTADIVVAAAGVPEFIDGEMIGEGATVIDVGINRVEKDGESTLVGDVDFESVRPVAGAITPVPGGVGPMTRAMLLYNTVAAAAAQAEVDIQLP